MTTSESQKYFGSYSASEFEHCLFENLLKYTENIHGEVKDSDYYKSLLDNLLEQAISIEKYSQWFKKNFVGRTWKQNNHTNFVDVKLVKEIVSKKTLKNRQIFTQLSVFCLENYFGTLESSLEYLYTRVSSKNYPEIKRITKYLKPYVKKGSVEESDENYLREMSERLVSLGYLYDKNLKSPYVKIRPDLLKKDFEDKMIRVFQKLFDSYTYELIVVCCDSFFYQGCYSLGSLKKRMRK